MLYLTYTPQPPLSDFVEVLWLYQNCYPAHVKERVLPTGTAQLIINLHDDFIRTYNRHNHQLYQNFSGCLLAGPQTGFGVIDTASQIFNMGVQFKPAGAFPFLNLPADELQDLDVSLDVLWGAAAHYLREQLLEAKTPEAKFGCLEQALLAQLNWDQAPHPAVVFAVQALQKQALPAISTLAEQIGLSQRAFIQRFRHAVGLPPKLFSRVQRFQQVLRSLLPEQPVDWTDLALTCGYFDQAHFIHDFQAFSGLNPTTYLARRNKHYNHVPLPD